MLHYTRQRIITTPMAGYGIFDTSKAFIAHVVILALTGFS